MQIQFSVTFWMLSTLMISRGYIIGFHKSHVQTRPIPLEVASLPFSFTLHNVNFNGGWTIYRHESLPILLIRKWKFSCNRLLIKQPGCILNPWMNRHRTPPISCAQPWANTHRSVANAGHWAAVLQKRANYGSILIGRAAPEGSIWTSCFKLRG